ncbi:MAG: DAK2 domain-containing protein [Actinobacteria bacterium]|nr:DAK2 domain-containing protein [Actinomycetota bacterium]
METTVGEGAALDGDHLAPLLERVHAVLVAHRTEVDDLNVFPVPDGDTGTNMVMTVRATLDGLATVSRPDDRCEAVTRAAMRGARGNSGVILSQVLRALAETIAAQGDLGADGVADFLHRARTLAYEAVADPVEGTILSAIAAAAAAAEEAVAGEASLVAAVTEVRDAVHRAVGRTPDQLAVLRDAGVVDAGARGFELVVDALLGHVSGQRTEHAATPTRVCRGGAEVPMADAGSLTYRFEVQYVLDADEGDAPGLRASLEELGDSVVVVAAGDLMTVHVHTNDVGAAIEAGLLRGRPSGIEVTYFAEQIAAHKQSRLEATATAAAEAAATVTGAAPPQRLGCVVVLPGPGLRSVAEGLGAAVVTGGPGALPSVADLLNAIGDVRAERIVILPGHRNVVPTAIQASDVSVAEGGRTLDVVTAADTTPAALAALAVSDPAGEPDDVLADMQEAAAAVRSGEVVAAVRDATTPLGDVVEGQWLAVVDGDVVAVTDEPLDALRAVVAACGETGCDLVTLVVGADVDEEEAEAAETAVRDALDGSELQVVAGGQRPARYLVGVE